MLSGLLGSGQSSIGRLTCSAWHNVRWGVREATWYVALYTAVGLAGVVVNLIKAGGAPLWWLIGVPAFYLIGGASAGAIVGLLRPLTRSLLGAVVTGIVAAVPIAVTGLLLIRGFLVDDWTGRQTIIFVVGISAVFGTTGAIVLKNAT